MPAANMGRLHTFDYDYDDSDYMKVFITILFVRDTLRKETLLGE